VPVKRGVRAAWVPRSDWRFLRLVFVLFVLERVLEAFERTSLLNLGVAAAYLILLVMVEIQAHRFSKLEPFELILRREDPSGR
jgi:hypothetical protein